MITHEFQEKPSEAPTSLASEMVMKAAQMTLDSTYLR